MMHRTTDTAAAFVFPGIGVELSGYEKGLFSKYRQWYRPLFDEASEGAECDLAGMLAADAVPDLTELQSQYFIYAFSAGTARVCTEYGWRPYCTAGYSFGVYAALVAAGVLSFTDGKTVFEKAYQLMTGCIEKSGVRMCAVIGLTMEECAAIISRESLATIHHTNSNNETCHIFCGDRLQIAALNRAALAADAVNAVELTVSLPYHHPGFARHISGAMTAFCDTISWNTPEVPLYSTIDFTPLTTAGAVKDFIVRQLTTPINWHATVAALYTGTCDVVIECGPGISLTQNARFISGGAKWLNCKNLERRLQQ